MSEFFDYDPLTGVKSFFDYDELSGVATIREEQNIQPFVDYATKVRNSGLTDKGIKEDWWKYCIIPTVVQLELLNKGINILDPDPDVLKRAFKEINENYPHLKLTEKHHQ